MNDKERIFPNYYNNAKEDNRESRTYTQLKKAYNEIEKILFNQDVYLYLAGGIVPYILLNEDSLRMHDDIDTVCSFNDISKIRKIFKNTEYYIPEWDSLNYSNNNIDYGFEIKIKDVPVGIYPFKYYNDNLALDVCTFDSYLKIGKIKRLDNITNINKFVKEYTGKDGKIYHTMALEYIKKSKDLSNRPKDVIDSQKISEFGYDKNVYNEITLFKEEKKYNLKEE